MIYTAHDHVHEVGYMGSEWKTEGETTMQTSNRGHKEESGNTCKDT